MRICIISQYFPPDMGGASTRVSNAIKGLRSFGHEIFVVTAFPHYPQGHIPKEYRGRAFAVEGDEKVRVFRVWVPPLPHKGGAKRLIMYASFTLFSLLALPFCGKVDVIWAASPNYFCSFPGLFYKLAKRSPLVLDVVDLWPEALVNLGFLKSRFIIGLVSASVDFFYKVSDRIITLNQSMRSRILKHGDNLGKVFIVENAADLKTFRPLKTKRPGFLRGKFVVMYSGNLGPMYDFDAVLKAARNLSKFRDIAFVLRGSGECAREIGEKIRHLELRNVFLLTEVLDVKQVARFLNLADIFLLPIKKFKDSEISFPLKLLEYLACGKPIICCAESETARTIDESKAGLLANAGNHGEISDLILKVRSDRDYLNQLGENGRKFVLENFSLSKMSEKLEAVFESQSGVSS
jgi:glycosyltransferase involved in cell wall biosynthesis